MNIQHDSSPATVHLRQGIYHGTSHSTHRTFMNVPYAQPPVGNLRWKKPQKLHSNPEQTNDATKVGPCCPQPATHMDFLPGLHSSAEHNESNCLNLNIWTPPLEEKPDKGWPVMVWIHGGGFVEGMNSYPLYDGTNLTKKHPVIVVSINYRVNIFGFLGSQELIQDSEDGSSGNYGLLDQRLAFEWVKENISHFGGDKTRICAFGESAGSVSIAYQLVISRGLFHRAILESGGADTLSAVSIEKQQIVFDEICRHLDITEGDRLAKLREISAETLVDALDKVSVGAEFIWMGTIDGVTIKQNPGLLYQDPKNIDPSVKEMIIGETTDEGTLFTDLIPLKETFKATLESKFSPHQTEVIKRLYPCEEPGELLATIGKICGDQLVAGPVRETTRALAHGSNPARKVYSYRFNAPMEKTAGFNLGVHHIQEVYFVFNQTDYLNEKEQKVSEKISQFWVNFATNGVPDDEWEPFLTNRETKLVFEPNGIIRNQIDDDEVRDKRLLFWKSFREQH
ncbi:hypothetical protein K7432_010196 [Basidiobolus ranarum]|uniref:Carboxylesterase type B domain-containing protein n=1 Tax=Basidiobolus ranarum TaxID=34480 RepID=A0ABR2WP48_9FUNG